MAFSWLIFTVARIKRVFKSSAKIGSASQSKRKGNNQTGGNGCGFITWFMVIITSVFAR
jgi:hypothetical protein